jgi:shikimate dehydrogenase
MKLYGLIGYPLSHSFSKKYFAEKFEKEKLTDTAYELFPIKSATEIKNIVATHPALRGLNVTIPHKKTVIDFLDDSTAIPAEVNACNCIKISSGKLIGYNTDVIGFEKSLLPNLQPHHTKALILGNGGAGAAVKFVLKNNNIPYSIAVRKKTHENFLLYEKIDERVMATHTIIINTTPVGTSPNVDECPLIPYKYLTQKHFLYDLVYNPEKTLFLQKGEEQGAFVKNGYEMLILQAEESWRIWNSG